MNVTSSSLVVVDASFLIKLWVQEEFSERAREIRVTWGRSRVARYAPALVDYEIVSTLNQKQLRGSLTADEADAVLELALEEPLNIIRTQDAHRDALRLARRHGLRSTYDAHYLALADDLDCEFWTADERLYNAVRERFPFIRWLGAA
jgi:predicted nucleic acid-binding protein